MSRRLWAAGGGRRRLRHAKLRRTSGVSSVTVTGPSVGSLLPRNMPILVTGTATGAGDLYATLDGGSSVGAGTASGGAFSFEVTALLADIGATELQIRRTTDDVVVGTRTVVVAQLALWAPTERTRGSWATDEAIGEAQPWALVGGSVSVTAGQSDPIGGSGAYRLAEATDGEAANHRYRETPSSAIGSYVRRLIWLKAVPGGREWYRYGPVASGTASVDLSTSGSYGNLTYGEVLSVTAASGGYWFDCMFTYLAWTVLDLMPCSSQGVYTYQGDGRDCCDAYLPNDATNGLTQTRLSDVTDQSGVGADLAQATAANQRLAWDETDNGIVVMHREAGRVSRTGCADATVLAVASGDDPSFSVLGIWGGTGNGAAPAVWTGAGTIKDIPLYIDGAELKSKRDDGTTEDVQTYGSGLAASVASGCKYAVIGEGSRVRKLYIDGSLVGTVTHADLNTAAMTAFNDGQGTITTPDDWWGDLALMTGTTTYAVMTAALESMATPYGRDD